MTRPRRSASTSEKKDSEEEGTKETPPLRRSTREREPAHQPQTTPLVTSASPKPSRMKRKGRGIPMGSHETASEDAQLDALPEEEAALTNSPLAAVSVSATKGGRLSKKIGRNSFSLISRNLSLTAAHRNGKAYNVRLVVNGKAFPPVKNRKGAGSPVAAEKSTGKQPVQNFLGQDGNLYYCVVCSDVGDVVCCDGCPHVYHPKCVPEGSASRQSLENDDDPWYCPDCTSKKTPVKDEDRTEGRRKRAIKHSCHECQQTRTDLSLKPCKVCGVYIHHPPCVRATQPSEGETNTAVMCSSCRAEAALTEEEFELHSSKKTRHEEGYSFASPESNIPERSKTTEECEGRARTRSIDKEDRLDYGFSLDNMSVEEGSEHDGGLPFSGGKKRKQWPNFNTEEPESESKETKRKKKKKKKKNVPEEGAEEDMVSMGNDGNPDQGESPISMPGVAQLSLQGPPTSATPAFHFYLADMRPKAEKVLMKKHKAFARLPKGNKRNALIAKEVATWWVKLSSVDQKKYIDMSMRDYEARIIAWKEEKNLREMLVDEAEVDGDGGVVGAGTSEKAQDEEMLRYEMHQRLYLGTSVGSKPYKPEEGESHNRVLLDLLRDMRFHPLPMFSATRSGADLCTVDGSKACMPFFDVHGPIATSVGDECLGCTRGWPHFCPVLQRRMPACEPRAKLQPPLSSLVASRVGLGLRPYLERTEIEEGEDTRGEQRELLAWRESKDATALQNQRFVLSGTLSDPSSRADDIVQFVEETLAMKIPEPPRPEQPGKHSASPKKTMLVRGTLPTRHKRPSDSGTPDTSGDTSNTNYEHVGKCGRCRTIIMTDTGCVQCRRAQLVINLSRQPPCGSVENKGDQKKAQKVEEQDQGDSLRVHVAMLSRVLTKDNIGESQSDGDKRVSAAMLRQMWSPCAILPPQKILAPSPSLRSSKKSERSEADKVSSEEAAPEVVSSEVHEAVQHEKPKAEGFTHRNHDGSNAELRPRNAKRVAATPGTFDNDDTERQLAAKQYRGEADKIHKRTLSIACCGILLGLVRRDPLLLFAQPVSAEGYAAVIKNPIDFSKIRKDVLSDNYSTLGAFAADVRLLCDNALIFNPPGSIYWKTAKELSDVLVLMQKRANRWITAIKNSHASFWRKSSNKKKQGYESPEDSKDSMDLSEGDPFEGLRETWPSAVDLYENSTWIKNLLMADFNRTRENETAYYGSLAVRRAAIASEECLAPYTDTSGAHSVVVKRSHVLDEKLRQKVDSRVANVIDPVQLKDIATAREEAIVRLMRKVQNRRLEQRIGSESGCARCGGMGLDHDMKVVMNAEKRLGRSKKKSDGEPNRVASSRLGLTTGLASANTRERIDKRSEQDVEAQCDSVNDVCVSLRGSGIHGWGLFAEQPFKKGDVVSEYIGECVNLPVADARERMYQEMRIQDYQFRLDDSQIIDATMKGGLGRYINHNCNPNCRTKIISGKPPNHDLRRVLIIAQRDIEPREELTYDYQFPLELNLNARIPCNCQSEVCRGFMNWDLPEKGANTGALRTQKRGANMRDRIRRLGRPLKK